MTTTREDRCMATSEVFTIDDGLQVLVGGLTVNEVRELVHDARLVAPERAAAEFDRSCEQ